MIRNVPFALLETGQSVRERRRVSADDIALFAHAAGGAGLLQAPPVDLDGDGKSDAAIPAAFLFALVASLVNMRLPGPGTIIRSVAFERRGIARAEDIVDIEVTCRAKGEAPRATFGFRVTDAQGAALTEGTMELDAPFAEVEVESLSPPVLIIDRHDAFAGLIARARRLPPLVTAVVSPDEPAALAGALAAARAGLIVPVLVGDQGRLEATARTIGATLAGITIIDAPDATQAAARAVAMVAAGEAFALMKGNLHSDTLLAAVMKREAGLRDGRRLSHVYVMDAPTMNHLLFITDAAINIAPDLAAKVDIVQNAIDLARACGLEKPKVGILSAVETVNPNIPSTLDAAILSKMAERGQITGGLVDGPLAMDNAVDVEAARTKGIASLVAGRADILVAPNLEAGNILAKELTFLGRATAAGLAVGARIPVILTSRADNDATRLASCALAQLYQHWRRTGHALGDTDPLDEA
jgi:phosphate butyryltransferase